MNIGFSPVNIFRAVDSFCCDEIGLQRSGKKLLQHCCPPRTQGITVFIYISAAEKARYAFGMDAHLFCTYCVMILTGICTHASPPLPPAHSQLWIQRINAACQAHGLAYNKFMHGLVQVYIVKLLSLLRGLNVYI